MAHSGQKIGFSLVSSLGRCQGIPQQLLLPGLLRPLAVQHLHQFNGQHIVIKGILHINNLHRQPVVLAVHSHLLKLHVDVPFSGGKPGQDVLSGKGRFKILPIGWIHIGNIPLYHLRVASAAPGQTSVLVLYKTIINILCQVQAHNQGIGRTDRRPE